MIAKWAPALGFVALMTSVTAPAAMVVHDPTNYVKLVEQAQTALQQLQNLRDQVEQTRRLVQTLDESGDLDGLLEALSHTTAGQKLPDAAALGQLLDGGSASGGLASRARDIRQARRVIPEDHRNDHWTALEAAGRRAARDLALAEAASRAAGEHAATLRQMTEGVAQAQTARDVLDLQAYAASAQVQATNDLLHLQALSMAQAAEADLARQTEIETAALARAERMALYRASFRR